MVSTSGSKAEDSLSPRRAFLAAAAIGLLSPLAAKAWAAFGGRPRAAEDDGAPVRATERRAPADAFGITYTYDELARLVTVVEAVGPRRTIEYACPSV